MNVNSLPSPFRVWFYPVSKQYLPVVDVIGTLSPDDAPFRVARPGGAQTEVAGRVIGLQADDAPVTVWVLAPHYDSPRRFEGVIRAFEFPGAGGTRLVLTDDRGARHETRGRILRATSSDVTPHDQQPQRN